ncbi:MAG: DUF3667 domain-containing protein [Gammaproteobacteria bacterium]|jgi:hypothetical protein|nr:DUF3667 domain-containing protein [Gammaproteobacteria bacterium]MDP7455505.1 DUF3667 domain-containing protein [Gammaproteobacteria bacterium]|tara:strand:- start:1241 stop:2263 length:1023 start_codon:yes stop_codon:yes gene_type:complete
MSKPGLSLAEFQKCLNCNYPLQGEFCSNCGQQNKEIRSLFIVIVLEALEGLFAFNSRSYKTLFLLLFKPAHLSLEYLQGKRARYLPPLRLFIVFSLGYFLLLSTELYLNSLNATFGADPAVPTTSEEAADIATENAAAPADDVEVNFSAELDNENLTEEEVFEFVGNISLPFFSAQRNEQLQVMLTSQMEANMDAITENPLEFFLEFGAQLLENLPLLVLFFLPVLALIQKIVYFSSGRYYIEHLILTVHNHSFLFFALILGVLLSAVEGRELLVLSPFAGLLDTVISYWVVVYLYLSFKYFFEQGHIVTFFKFVTASIIYGICLSIGLFFLAIFAFFTF